MIAFFGQWSGNGPVSYYYPQMLRGAGIENNNTRLLLQGLQNVVQFIGAVFGALITDRVGRRPQLLVSTGLIVILFAIVLALNATNVVDGPDGEPIAKSGVTARAQIAMIFIFGFVYSAGWTPNQAMYPVECLRYESRAKGMGMNNVRHLAIPMHILIYYPPVPSYLPIPQENNLQERNKRKKEKKKLTRSSSSSTSPPSTTPSSPASPSPAPAGNTTSCSSSGTRSSSSSSGSCSSRPASARWRS